MDYINVSTLSDSNQLLCESEITIEDLKGALLSMDNDKSPGNDGLNKEFYVFFWENIKNCIFESIQDAKQKGVLSSSQRQAIIKLIEKKDRYKRYIKNWRPISLLNIDTKMLSKVLASKVRKVLPSIIKCDQTAYVANRFIGESIRMTSDILELTKKLKIGGFILTMDIEKAFDSVDHVFLLAVLEKMGFRSSFLSWIQILLKNQESCVMNGGNSTGYFKLERGTRQGDPISAYLFIIVLEVFFIMIRDNEHIQGIKLFNFEYKLTSYADDTTFFIKNEESVKEILKTFGIFSKFSGLNLNTSKCEIAGIGVKRGVKVALCGLKEVNLNEDAIQILGVSYSYNEKVSLESNYLEVVERIEKEVSTWRWRNLTLSGKITIFKTLAFSKIVFLSYLTNIPNSIIEKIENIQKDFIWNGKRAKINHLTLINSYENGGLKDIDIKLKIKSLQLSWIKRLFEDSFHPWKHIPNTMFGNSFSQNIFYPNLSIKIPQDMPLFYKNIVRAWIESANCEPLTKEAILRQSVWNNKHILIGNQPVVHDFSVSLFVFDLYTSTGDLITWEIFKNKHNLSNSAFFKWRQIINAIPLRWKIKLRDIGESDHFQFVEKRDQYFLFLTRLLPIDRLTSKQFYLILSTKIQKKPTSETKIENILGISGIQWEKVHTLARKSTIDNYSRQFHFKLTHNILYLNKSLHKMGLANTPLCPFCKSREETTLHLFYDCIIIKNLWARLTIYFATCLSLPNLTPQSAILGFYENNDILTNQIHLIFKISVYHSRSDGSCNLQKILNKIKKIKLIEDNLTFLNENQRNKNTIKWAKIISIL